MWFVVVETLDCQTVRTLPVEFLHVICAPRTTIVLLCTEAVKVPRIDVRVCGRRDSVVELVAGPTVGHHASGPMQRYPSTVDLFDVLLITLLVFSYQPKAVVAGFERVVSIPVAP